MKLYRLAWRAIKQVAWLLRWSGVLRLSVKGRRVGAWIVTFLGHLLRPFLPNPLVVEGHKIHYSPKESFVFLAEITLEGYLSVTDLTLRRLLRPGMTIVDAGAHIGYYTLLFARAVGSSGRVVSFEPDPSNRALLERNVRVNGYEGVVSVVPRALAKEPGSLKLFLGKDSGMFSSIYINPLVTKDAITVEATSLDAFFAGEGWPTVDLIKMNIEGAEKAALEGMGELSRRNPGLKLIIQVHPPPLRPAAATPEELLHLLSQLGFAKIWVMAPQLIPLDPNKGMGPLLDNPDIISYLFCEKE